VKTQQLLKRLPQISSFGRRFLLGVICSILLTLTLTLGISQIQSVNAQAPQTSINFGSSSVVGIVNGSTIPVKIKLANLSNPNGLSTGVITLNYDPNLVTVKDSDGDDTVDSGVVSAGSFLSLGGRQAWCGSYLAGDKNSTLKKYVTIACTSSANNDSPGPVGSGDFATVNFTPGANIGLSTLGIKSSQLVDNTISGNLIPHTKGSLNIRVAPCADYDNNGIVLIPDILSVVRHYGTEDPLYDLDNSGLVLTADISIAVLEYGMECTRS